MYRIRYQLSSHAVKEYYIEKKVKTLFGFLGFKKSKWVQPEHYDYDYGASLTTYETLEKAVERVKQMMLIDLHAVDPIVYTNP